MSTIISGTGEENENKKAKLSRPLVEMSEADKVADVIHPDLFGKLDEFKKQYRENTPYNFCVFPKLCVKKKIEAVRDEVINNLETKFKETDLFKIYQTTDLANLDETNPELAAKLPSMLELRDAVYSKRFREFVSEISGCGELTDRVDMAATAYAQGCHLLCHDDVIGTRAVSFIIYFSAEDWTEVDGGALELYPLEKDSIVHNNLKSEDGKRTWELDQGIPTALPTRRHLPLLNHMAFFQVVPGQSFHSVQEVLRDGSPRLSIQGWFHNKEEPLGTEMASLNQLKTAKMHELPFIPFASPQKCSSLLEDDVAFLSNWVNSVYLSDESIQAIGKKYEEESSVQLKNFLRDDIATTITKQCEAMDTADGYMTEALPNDNAGFVPNDTELTKEQEQEGVWRVLGPAHMQRYVRYVGGEDVEEGKGGRSNAKLAEVEVSLFRSEAFARYLAAITEASIGACKTETRRFRSGLDYTVAHLGQLEKVARLDATLCFVDDKEELKGAQWQSGDVGGFQCYLAAENEDNVAAEVYCDDDASGNDLLSISPSNNTLSLVYRDPGTMRFVKFISAASSGSRFDVSSVYDIQYDDNDEDGEGEDDDEEEEEEK
eukprot:m.41550 g.41550  ORF g.41550 m.41550 type:complete len:603 (+) comp10436_c0_seq1:142-1950(+)